MEPVKHKGGMPKGARNPAAGRKPGSLNKVTAIVKANVLAVFDAIGGVQRMAEWAAENPTDFYKIYFRLMATETQLSGTYDGPIATALTVTFVKPNPA